MKKIIEQIAERILNAKCVKMEEDIVECPWQCSLGTLVDRYHLYSWTPEEGFTELHFPRECRRTAQTSASSYDEGEVVDTTISHLREILPNGAAYVLLHIYDPWCGTWDPQWRMCDRRREVCIIA